MVLRSESFPAAAVGVLPGQPVEHLCSEATAQYQALSRLDFDSAYSSTGGQQELQQLLSDELNRHLQRVEHLLGDYLQRLLQHLREHSSLREGGGGRAFASSSATPRSSTQLDETHLSSHCRKLPQSPSSEMLSEASDSVPVPIDTSCCGNPHSLQAWPALLGNHDNEAAQCQRKAFRISTAEATEIMACSKTQEKDSDDDSSSSSSETTCDGVVAAVLRERRRAITVSPIDPKLLAIASTASDQSRPKSLRVSGKKDVLSANKRRQARAAREGVNKQSLTKQIQEMDMLAVETKRNLKQGRPTGRLSEKDVPAHGWRLKAQQLLGSQWFDIVVFSVILINAASIGIQVDMSLTSRDTSESLTFQMLEKCFAFFFTFEILLRWVAEGHTFFFKTANPKFAWNVFDTCLVFSGLVEEMIGSIIQSKPEVSANVLRLFRILRLVRIIRVVRVLNFFKDLRIMVSGILNSIQPMMWALLILLFTMYVFAVGLMQFVSEEVEARAVDPSLAKTTESEFKTMMTLYGSLPASLDTLYQTISGGIDWGNASRPLKSVNSALGLAFPLYISFSVLCVLNIVTGVFVENAKNITSQDHDMVLMEEIEHRKGWFEEVRQLFEDADEEQNGLISKADFSEKIRDLSMQARFRKLGVNVESYSAQGLFSLLDFDADGFLNLDEFAIALRQVHGPARSIDLARVNYEMHLIRGDLMALADLCLDIFEETAGRPYLRAE
eukprot:TRINITY_DN21893_c0_g1_i1.p1 TRINITY_DN21893_c0_g1~~TRINITY_DN21893_c0_g1_i1.p1  ORF type:complete len:726 (-),score=123.69 TRINITY_DN21893_c0_g1_i1:344-2521(-)